MPKSKPTVREYIIHCRLEYGAEVIVSAESPEEASQKFDAGEYEGEPRLLELVNWESRGEPKANE